MCLCFLSFLLAPAIAFRSLKSIRISLKNIRKGFEFIGIHFREVKRNNISERSIYRYKAYYDKLREVADNDAGN